MAKSKETRVHDKGPKTNDQYNQKGRTKRFTDLEVYRMSEKLSDMIWTIALTWEKFPKETLGKQMVRCGDSIGANISEGTGRGSYQENRRFIRIARGSLYELQHWLRRAYKRKLLKEADATQLRTLIDELTPRLNAYLRSIGTKKNNYQTTNDK